MSRKSNNSEGMPLAGVLTGVFTILKLCNVITWSWGWVLSPVWIGLASYLVIRFLLVGWLSFMLKKSKGDKK